MEPNWPDKDGGRRRPDRNDPYSLSPLRRRILAAEQAEQRRNDANYIVFRLVWLAVFGFLGLVYLLYHPSGGTPLGLRPDTSDAQPYRPPSPFVDNGDRNQELVDSWRNRMAAEREAERRRERRKQDFRVERERHATVLTVAGPAPGEQVPLDPPPPGATYVTYESGDLELGGWLHLAAVEEYRRHPIIVWAHAGHSLTPDDWALTLPLREAGLHVFAPAFRGENGNPGHFEYLYGEVDDLYAAVLFARTFPSVNVEAVIIVGDREGGELAALAAFLDPSARAIACVNCEVGHAVADLDPSIAPFDTSDPVEVRLRSVHKFPQCVQVPIDFYLSTGGIDKAWQPAIKDFCTRAHEARLEPALLTLIDAPPDRATDVFLRNVLIPWLTG